MSDSQLRLVVPFPTERLSSLQKSISPTLTQRLSQKLRRLVNLAPTVGSNLESLLDRWIAIVEKEPSVARKRQARARLLATEPVPRLVTTWQRAETARPVVTNPRPPSLPAGVINTPEEYYAACATIGSLSAQPEEPNIDEIVAYSCDYGERMAQSETTRMGSTPLALIVPRRNRLPARPRSPRDRTDFTDTQPFQHADFCLH